MHVATLGMCKCKYREAKALQIMTGTHTREFPSIQLNIERKRCQTVFLLVTDLWSNPIAKPAIAKQIHPSP